MIWRAATLAALAAVPVAAADLPRLALAPVRFAPKGDDRVGARRSGLICAPAGKLLWREVGADGADLATRAAARARAGGVDLAVASADRMEGGTPPSRLRLIATVDRVTMNACLPWRGLNVRAVRGPVKAGGRLAVTWRVFDVSSRALVLKVSSCHDFSGKSATTLAAALGEAFADAAETVVPVIDKADTAVNSPAPVELPPSFTCAAGDVPVAE